MKLNKIAVLEPGYRDYETERTILADSNVEIVSISASDLVAQKLESLDPVIVLLRESTFGKSEIDLCPNLKGIIRYGVGVDNIDCEYAKSRNIYVGNVPNYGAEVEVSEHALALYLSLQRRVSTRDQEVRGGLWGVGQAQLIPSRENAVLGLIGCGKIGLQAAQKFRALGFKEVQVFDPYLSAEIANQYDLTVTTLEGLCKTSDVISLHAPLTTETHHLLNRSLFEMMKPTTILINVSRGGLVNESDLAQALRDKVLFGAGIDVFEQEPPSLDNPLFNAPNTILSDHGAWYSERSVRILQENAALSALNILNGEAPLSWVNPW